MSWILSANSWMHTPAGYEIVDGTFHVTDWWAVDLQPFLPLPSRAHGDGRILGAGMVVAGVVGLVSAAAAGIAPSRRAGFSLAMWMVAIAAPLQVVIGDLHGLNTLEHQPMKVAAMEGHWETSRGMPLLLFAMPDQAAASQPLRDRHSQARQPDPDPRLDGEVKGLKEVPPAGPAAGSDRVLRLPRHGRDRHAAGRPRPARPVAALARPALYDTAVSYASWSPASPLGFVAILAGWVVTEVGRQPWTVYGHIRTADSVSPVAAGAVASSLALFVLVYSVLVLAFLLYAWRAVRRIRPAGAALRGRGDLGGSPLRLV